MLDVVHHLTAGYKALHTQECMDMILEIRQSLGGAGFTAWSALPDTIYGYSPNPTFEGDNTVMAQQSFNYLLKTATKIFSGTTPDGVDETFQYICQVNDLLGKTCPCKNMNDFLNLDNIDEALKVNLGLKLKRLVSEAAKLGDKFDRKAFING